MWIISINNGDIKQKLQLSLKIKLKYKTAYLKNRNKTLNCSSNDYQCGHPVIIRCDMFRKTNAHVRVRGHEIFKH